jgi:UDP-2,3-diacylglucosamine pyrophosphatase LpxH
MLRGGRSLAQVRESRTALRKAWRRFSERPHNLLALSDVHLGCDLKPGVPARARPADAALAAFLDWHAERRTGRKPWRLILNGDIVDFVAITEVPEGPQAFPVSDEERALGLAASEPKCVWKLQRTAERHPLVFDALARFVARGNSLHVVRGNHDGEWRWPRVQDELRRILLERAGLSAGSARRRFLRAIEFHEHFYLEPGFFYAEHGHAHDRYCAHGDVPDGAHEIELPLSSKVLRYFANRYSGHAAIPDDVDSWGAKEFLAWAARAGNPLRIGAHYFAMVARVIWEHLRHPRRLLDAMQLLYLDRMLAGLACTGAALGLGLLADGWPRLFGLLAVGVVFVALNLWLGRTRQADAHPTLKAAAHKVARAFDVKFVVMGHSHRPVEEQLGNCTRYFNLGSWTGQPGEGFPHLVVEGEGATLRRWKM